MKNVSKIILCDICKSRAQKVHDFSIYEWVSDLQIDKQPLVTPES